MLCCSRGMGRIGIGSFEGLGGLFTVDDAQQLYKYLFGPAKLN